MATTYLGKGLRLITLVTTAILAGIKGRLDEEKILDLPEDVLQPKIDAFVASLIAAAQPEDLPKIEQPKGATAILQAVIDNAVARLKAKFEREILVDPLPVEFTDESLAAWAKFNLRPVFMPDKDISRRQKISGYKKPEGWFYDRVDDGKIKPIAADLPPTTLRRGWYLMDFTVSADYTDGSQLFVNDPLEPIIAKLREQKKIGKHEKTPMGPRFSITWDEWQNPLLTYVASAYGFPRAQVRLERAIEFNFIGNVYDAERGKFNAYEWWEDQFGGSRRLCGGNRVYGGLANVYCSSSSGRSVYIAGRPLVSFAK